MAGGAPGSVEPEAAAFDLTVEMAEDAATRVFRRLAGTPVAGVAMLALLTLAKAVAAIALIYLVGARVVHKLFRSFAEHRQPDQYRALTASI